MKLLNKILGQKSEVPNNEFMIHNNDVFKSNKLFTPSRELVKLIKVDSKGKYHFDTPYSESHIKLMKLFIADFGSSKSNLDITETDVTMRMVEEVSHNLLAILNLNTNYIGQYMDSEVGNKVISTNLSADISLEIIVKCFLNSGVVIPPKVMYYVRTADLKISNPKD